MMVVEQRLLAKALYDNVAESQDELDFKRGDVITVLEQETGGLEGWWLCSLRGKQGIAPGNRLKMLTGSVANHVRSHTADFQTLPQPTERTHQEWNRRSWDGSTNKVVMPSRQGDMYTYTQPRGAQQPDYDIPTQRYPGLNTTASPAPGSNNSSREDLLNASGASMEQTFYDTPPQSRNFRSADFNMYDTPPTHLSLDSYDMPGGSVRTSLASKFSDETMSMSSGMSYNKSNSASMCDSARSSMDISPLDMYDVPPSQREREAREKSAALYPIRSSKDSGLDMYDSPPKLKSPPSMIDDYDVPKSAMDNARETHFKNIHIPGSEPSSPGDVLDDYDVPKSRSPFAQSTSSHVNNTSVRSETSDLEDYDVPRHPTPVIGKPPLGVKSKRQKSNSVGSILDDYDTPPTNPEKVSKDDSFAIKPKKTFDPEVSDEENNYDEPDQMDSESSAAGSGAKPKLQKQEHAVDDLYDSPRNNAPVKNMTKEFSALSVTPRPKPLGVYDIPPQVTRDSVISSRSDSSDERDNGSYRSSICSNDSRGADFLIYDELLLEHDAATDLIIKLQQDVQKSVTKFSTFVHSSWKKKDNIELKMYDIKQACNALEQALGEFVEFGQGTLANSAKLSDRKLINKLSKYLIPLQQALQQIRVSIKHMDDVEWQVSKLVHVESPKKDDLAIIISLSKDLGSDVKKLASFIQGNSQLLFKRAKDFNRSSRTPEHSTPTSAGRPPNGKKPAIPAKMTPVQTRPLPAPPPTERPLPPTPTDKKAPAFGFSGTDPKRLSGDFGNKRNSGDYKHWSGDIQVKRMSESDNSSFKVEDLVQEYDYVELEEDNKQSDDNGKTGSKEKGLDEISEYEKQEVEKVLNATDNYAKEMEKTLDEIDGVNIYSDDSGGTLKRDAKPPKLEDCDVENSDTEHDTGTLKRKPNDEKDHDSDTLKRDERPVRDTDDDSEKTPVNNEPENTEIPEQGESSTKSGPLLSEDKQVLAFYAEQLETHTTLLTNSIDAFFQCIETNQAPKVFISNSKFVVVSAHKLVYIGDTLHRNLKHEQVRNLIIQRANYLCDCLKRTVMSTKTAALQYPSVPAVQDMVDRVVDVSHAARDLKQFVSQVANL
ncbi:breast cancer anti-estrogen resistance protein 1-like isoform X2 [Mya arenaria]|uniref:breast cancer anti-estrogen resistance protein 1-like isoform X2 n=1 Tax=Mya arenaria TaxID=6604 RepID=UPI0022E8FEE4|nr:breast cancer anti-estrogen resistance protein 1-like isoform X2 [Mya arenaria]